jgi:Fibronectin type III-like domain
VILLRVLLVAMLSTVAVLPAADLAFWDVSAAGWNVEPITYEVAVGPSSRDLPLSGTFSVKD